MVLTNIVKHFVSLVILLFFTYLIGTALFDMLRPGTFREGLEGDAPPAQTTRETCKIPEASK